MFPTRPGRDRLHNDKFVVIRKCNSRRSVMADNNTLFNRNRREEERFNKNDNLFNK